MNGTGNNIKIEKGKKWVERFGEKNGTGKNALIRLDESRLKRN